MFCAIEQGLRFFAEESRSLVEIGKRSVRGLIAARRKLLEGGIGLGVECPAEQAERISAWLARESRDGMPSQYRILTTQCSPKRSRRRSAKGQNSIRQRLARRLVLRIGGALQGHNCAVWTGVLQVR